MKVRVLGAYGGELGPYRSSAFLLEGGVLLDAGGASGALGLEEARTLRACLVTHQHLDHIASIPFLLDARIGASTLPVYGLRETANALRQHLFNEKIWPDFQRIPDPRHPLLRYVEIERERPFSLGGFEVTPIAVDHTVPTVGYIVRDGTGSVVFSADTGPTRRIWEAVARLDDCRAVLLELSFPARLEKVAVLSKHLSTESLRAELQKIPAAIPIYLNHLKPAFLDEIARELAPIMIEHKNVRLLEQDRTYDF
jgi:ribonuclease BN (tRNA processing enzyme)